jgi:trans-2-enoyl-CoA reductase|tara:strand:- start:2462 stop:2668 length:207 start_codon:yes stop_codon:yes gene_type:complete
MTTQLKENNFSVETKKETLNKIKSQAARPNIDHLIKRIVVERRKEQKKNFLIFILISLVIGAAMIFSL